MVKLYLVMLSPNCQQEVKAENYCRNQRETHKMVRNSILCDNLHRFSAYFVIYNKRSGEYIKNGTSSNKVS